MPLISLDALNELLERLRDIFAAKTDAEMIARMIVNSRGKNEHSKLMEQRV